MPWRHIVVANFSYPKMRLILQDLTQKQSFFYYSSVHIWLFLRLMTYNFIHFLFYTINSLLKLKLLILAYVTKHLFILYKNEITKFTTIKSHFFRAKMKKLSFFVGPPIILNSLIIKFCSIFFISIFEKKW